LSEGRILAVVTVGLDLLGLQAEAAMETGDDGALETLMRLA
jgi:hypothetical protein